MRPEGRTKASKGESSVALLGYVVLEVEQGLLESAFLASLKVFDDSVAATDAAAVRWISASMARGATIRATTQSLRLWHPAVETRDGGIDAFSHVRLISVVLLSQCQLSLVLQLSDSVGRVQSTAQEDMTFLIRQEHIVLALTVSKSPSTLPSCCARTTFPETFVNQEVRRARGRGSLDNVIDLDPDLMICRFPLLSPHQPRFTNDHPGENGAMSSSTTSKLPSASTTVGVYHVDARVSCLSSEQFSWEMCIQIHLEPSLLISRIMSCPREQN